MTEESTPPATQDQRERSKSATSSIEKPYKIWKVRTTKERAMEGKV